MIDPEHVVVVGRSFAHPADWAIEKRAFVIEEIEAKGDFQQYHGHWLDGSQGVVNSRSVDWYETDRFRSLLKSKEAHRGK